MTKLLLVEDDVELCAKLAQWLKFEKYLVEVVHNGADAWNVLRSYQFDVIVLDWNLPEMSGVDICRNYRIGGGTAPILMLTGKDSVVDKEIGLDSGADDYLAKPFHIKELCARLRALLRRPSGRFADTINIGCLSLQTTTFVVSKNGEELHLQPKEFAILEFLMKHVGQVFSSKALLDHVWPSDSEASEDTVRFYIKTLRRKITAEGQPPMIQTIHGLGYKLVEPPTQQ